MTEFHYLALAFLSIGLIVSGGGALIAYWAHRDDLKLARARDSENETSSESSDM